MTTATSDLFALWVGQRDLPSVGTNDGANPIAFQSWHHFKEAFAPELVAQAVAASDLSVARCLDPFGGSGTTALTCQMLGIESTTVEVNPFLADVVRAKLARYECDQLASELALIRRRARLSPSDPESYFNFVPTSFVEPGDGSRWIFGRDVAERLASILSAIDAVAAQDDRRFFRIILGGMLVDVSNVVVSGKGRRYRRNWPSCTTKADTVDWLFAERCEMAILDIQRFLKRRGTLSRLVEGDARVVDFGDAFDLCVFSPPYPNSFDYTDVYNIQLWMLGYLSDSDSNRELRVSTLTSHVQMMRAYATAPSGSPTLDGVISRLDDVKETLWSPWIPSMIGGYFADLSSVVDRSLKALNAGADCWLIVGDSRYGGVTIPVATILSELASVCGWRVVEQVPIRHMKSSAQQGWRKDLAETRLVLRSDSR